jgi:hypothetical protein
MVSDSGKSSFASSSDRNLLKNKAIDSNYGIGMNYDPIGMWNEQPAANMAVERYVGASHDTPKTMTGDQPFENEANSNAVFSSPVLVSSDC